MLRDATKATVTPAPAAKRTRITAPRKKTQTTKQKKSEQEDVPSVEELLEQKASEKSGAAHDQANINTQALLRRAEQQLGAASRNDASDMQPIAEPDGDLSTVITAVDHPLQNEKPTTASPARQPLAEIDPNLPGEAPVQPPHKTALMVGKSTSSTLKANGNTPQSSERLPTDQLMAALHVEPDFAPPLPFKITLPTEGLTNTTIPSGETMTESTGQLPRISFHDLPPNLQDDVLEAFSCGNIKCDRFLELCKMVERNWKCRLVLGHSRPW